MGKYGPREDRTVDGGGYKKIPDILPKINDEIECILIDVETKEGQDGKAYRVFHLFTDEHGEMLTTGSGSNFAKVFDDAIKANRFDPSDSPCLAVGVESISKWTSDRGEPLQQHKVYIERISEDPAVNKSHAMIAQFRSRAFRGEQAQNGGISVPQSRQQNANALDAIFDDSDAIPF